MKNIMDAGKSNDTDENILARRRKKEVVEKKRETKDTKPVERRVNYPDETKPFKPPTGHPKVEDMKKVNPAAIENELPKPLKLPPGRQNTRAVVVKGETSLRKAEEEQTSRNRKSKEKEEEERMMDKLLMHYSMKQSPYQQKEVEASLKQHHPMTAGVDMGSRAAGKESRRRNKEGRPAKPSSVQPEQMNAEREGLKRNGHGRNGLFKQEMLSLSPAGNVHPNLPDYEDLIAKFAAFKGN